MTLKCKVCGEEFELPKITNKIYHKCPKCGTLIQQWGYICGPSEEAKPMSLIPPEIL